MPTPKIGLPLGARGIVMRVQREGAAPSAEGMLALPPADTRPLPLPPRPYRGLTKVPRPSYIVS